MPMFRKKPITIEAIQFTGDASPILEFAGRQAMANAPGAEPLLTITTPEGNMTVSEGDWVIRGIKGEFYPCKPDIFAATYDEVVA